MPIPRDKFDRGPAPDARVIEFLDDHPDSAYTLEEIEVELRMKGKPGGPSGASDPMFDQEGDSGLKSLLEKLSRDRKIQSQKIDGQVYYCSTKPPASSSQTASGGRGSRPKTTDESH